MSYVNMLRSPVCVWIFTQLDTRLVVLEDGCFIAWTKSDLGKQLPQPLNLLASRTPCTRYRLNLMHTSFVPCCAR